MKVIEIDCFEVTEEFTESKHEAYFLHQSAAQSYASRSNYRRVYPFKKTFIICESLSDVDLFKKEVAINKAKSKLTKEELIILGLE